MNKDIADRWIAKLRSGKYGQVYGRLRDEKEYAFCCLGVLCDLYREEQGTLEWRGSAAIVVLGGADAESARGQLPDNVTEWAEMRSALGDLPASEDDPVEDPSLAILNDNGWSFARIADVIEQHWEDL
jgi:hypothetical protein